MAGSVMQNSSYLNDTTAKYTWNWNRILINHQDSGVSLCIAKLSSTSKTRWILASKSHSGWLPAKKNTNISQAWRRCAHFLHSAAGWAHWMIWVMERSDYSRPELSHVWETSEVALVQRVDAWRASCSLAFMKNMWNWFGPSHEEEKEEENQEEATDDWSTSTLPRFRFRPAAPESYLIFNRVWNVQQEQGNGTDLLVLMFFLRL